MPGESGASQEIVSLSGGKAPSGVGRNSTNFHVTAGAAAVLVLSDNPKRIAAIIANEGPAPCWLALGEDAVVNYGIPLPLNGVFQIDNNVPWTGYVSVIGSGAAGISGVEVSSG